MKRFLLRLSVMLLTCGVILAGAMIAAGKALPSSGQLLYGTRYISTLYALDLNSGIQVPLTRESVMPNTIVLSPDGTQLAFLIGYSIDLSHRLMVMNVDGTHARYIEGYFIERPQWLPDSTHLMLPNAYNRVQIINVLDKTSNEILLSIAECHWFDLSPDGRHIAFYKYMETRGRCEPHVIDADGNNLRNLPFDAFPYWSPDSQQIVMLGQHNVFLVDLEDIEHRQTVFPNPAYTGFVWGAVRWSTDATQIIFVENRSSDIYMLRIHPEIGSPTRLNLTTLNNMTPIWSPNDEEIAYVVGTSDWEIYVASADGTHLRRVTYNNVLESIMAWLP